MEYFKSPTGEVYGYDPLTQQDLIDQAIANGWQDVTGSWPPAPQPPTADENKEYAKGLLANTDWVELPSVTDTTRSPHLLNPTDFLTYRDAIRVIAVNPVAGDINWPALPTSQWSS